MTKVFAYGENKISLSFNNFSKDYGAGKEMRNALRATTTAHDFLEVANNYSYLNWTLEKETFLVVVITATDFCGNKLYIAGNKA